MKTNLISIIGAVVLAFAGAAGLRAQDAQVNEVRKVDAFSSIEIASVGTIYFTQGDTYSLKIEGKEKYVKDTETTVRDSCLLIGFREQKENVAVQSPKKQGVTIRISAPDLKNVEFTGVGSFHCEGPLRLDRVRFQVEGVGKVYVEDLTCRTLKVELEGVGKARIHVHCDYLSADMDGVGGITLSGTAGKAEISKGGIGSVNTKGLKVGR